MGWYNLEKKNLLSFFLTRDKLPKPVLGWCYNLLQPIAIDDRLSHKKTLMDSWLETQRTTWHLSLKVHIY
jgi:hypothetical protein